MYMTYMYFTHVVHVTCTVATLHTLYTCHVYTRFTRFTHDKYIFDIHIFMFMCKVPSTTCTVYTVPKSTSNQTVFHEMHDF